MLPPSAPYSRPAVAVVVAGLLITAAVALLWGARAASFVLAGVSAGLGIARLVLPKARLQPFAIRDQWLDVTLMVGCAIALVVLASIAPF